MVRPFTLFIGLRYLSTGRGRGFVSFMSAASLIGIALGVAALLVILSAMNGLEAEQRARLLSMSVHMTVRPVAQGGFAWRELAAELRADEAVTAALPFVQLEGMLGRTGRIEPVLVRGVDPAVEGSGSELAEVVGADRLAALEPGEDRVLIGRTLASRLGAEVGDRIMLYLPEATDSIPRARTAALVVAGIFFAGLEAHDANLALVHLADASAFARLGGEPEGLALKLAEPISAPAVEARLQAATDGSLLWSNWADENRSLYDAMAIEKIMMTIILMLIVAVAAFNVVGSLMMTVTEKQKDIAILRTMGLAPQRVTRIFLVQGATLGIVGTLAGVVLGLVLAANLETILPWLERTFGFQIMPGDVFYVSRVPSEIRAGDVLLIPGVALVITLLATVFPSRRAARIDPAEVLRYE